MGSFFESPRRLTRRDVIWKTSELAATAVIMGSLGFGDSPKGVSADIPHVNLPYKNILPLVSFDQRASVALPTPENFQWTRSEILFGSNAGFQKLREGEMVAIYVPPELLTSVTEDAIYPWNKLGIELRGKPYAAFTSDLPTADIHFLPTNETWVEPVNRLGKTDHYEPFYKVTIHAAADINNQIASHELGHAICGFVDFLDPVEYNAYINKTTNRGYINPQNGSDPNKPYIGVMNYMDWTHPELWFGKDDRSLLELGGYV